MSPAPSVNDHVTRFEFAGNLRDDIVFVRHKLHVQMTLSLDRLIKRFARHAGDRILSGRINFRQHQPIGALESGQKLIEKISGPGEIDAAER